MRIPTLSSLLARSRHVFLDFDGPVCDVFAGYSAEKAAAELRALAEAGGRPVPDLASGPHDVLRHVADVAPQLASRLDEALAAAELAAVETAVRTPGIGHLLATCVDTRRPVTIVSNNSADAIHAYLDAQRLAVFVRHVEGRPEARRMKPDPYLLLRALEYAGIDATSAVFIGDTITDIEAARSAAVPVIAYANSPAKRAELATADAVTTSIADLAHAMEPYSHRLV